LSKFFFNKKIYFEELQLEEISSRITLISKFIESSKYFIPTTFQLSGNVCVRTTKKLKFANDNLSINERIKLLLTLSNELALFSKNNFIHGDLNQKNIKLTKDGYVVLDFEPLLSIIKNGKKLHMCTFPYVSEQDLDDDIVTSRTDKLSFDMFCKKKMDYRFTERLSIEYVNKIYLRTNSHYNVTFQEIVLNNINQPG
jgi:hypothetical protein